MSDDSQRPVEQTTKQKPTKAEKPSIKKHLAETKPPVPRVVVEPKSRPKNTATFATKPVTALKERKQTAQATFTQVPAKTGLERAYASSEPALPAKEVIDELLNQPETLDFENVELPVELLSVGFDRAETGISLNSEVIFDDETLETFTQLLDLVTIEQAPAPELAGAQELSLLEDQVVLFSQEISEPIMKNTFEEFVMARDESEVFLELDEIRAVANEKPLEESLVCLVSLLQEVPDENEDVTMLVHTLHESFSRINAPGVERRAAGITPEITQKLLSLLRLIGYQNPREVLLDFITRHDLEFLIQALRYLAQLAGQDNQPELLPFKPFNPFLEDAIKPITYRLGKVVLELAKGSLQFSAVKTP